MSRSFRFNGVLFWFCMLFCCLGGQALGQVEMNLAFEQDTYLVNESIVATLRVRNVSDVPLVFGSDYSNAELGLRIRHDGDTDRSGGVERSLDRELVVMPGDTGSLLIEFSSQFQMVRTGTYRASAVVVVGGRRYRTAERLVDVVSGIELQHVRRPVSGYLDKSFDYSLRYWNRNDAEYLFLSISDKEEGLLYGTFMLGRLLRLRPPRIEFIPGGEVKVIHQSAAGRITVSTLQADRAGVTFIGQEHFRPDGTRVE
jgi:hypothetical protein